MKVIFQSSTAIGMILLLLLVFQSCSQVVTFSEESFPFGFVGEIDEPTTRGKLTRITPPDMNIRYRFDVSSDGKQIVFTGRNHRERGKPYDLHLLEIGAKNPIKLTAGSRTSHWDPSFTEDGEHIIYSSLNKFWKIGTKGTGAKVVVPGSGIAMDNYPHCSVEDIIVFISYEYNLTVRKNVIWSINLDGSSLTQYREGNYPRWSPDGKKITFEFERDIWVMDKDGTNLTQLTATKYIKEGKPCFSPNGNYVVYVSNENVDGGSFRDLNIWIMKLDGSMKTQLTELESWDSWPVWSGSYIYFLSGRAGAKGNDVQRIWRIETEIEG